MGMIKGFYLDSKGQVHTYWAQETIQDPVVPKPRRDWKKKRRNQIRCNVVRASMVVSVLGAMGFTMSLAAESPNWAVGIGGAILNMAWFFTVLIRNGGKINVERF